MNLPEPFRDGGDLVWQIAPEISAIVSKTSGSFGGRPPRAQRWTVEVHGPVYICQCLPTRKACIDAIPRLLRAMP